MEIINVHDARTHPSRLLDDVAGGKEMMLAKNGKTMARLSPLLPAKRVLPYGLLTGKLKLHAGFDDPLPDDVTAGFPGR
jgi:antitoxin (DNA-binding transcriptional repressor) of toxin-antitoxin stability system